MEKNINKKEESFKIPEGYFNDFTDRVMDNIEKENKKTSLKDIKPMFKTVFWLAASFVIVFGMGKIVFSLAVDPNQKIQNTNQSVYVDNVKQTESTDYFFDDIDMSDEEIIDYLSEQDINQEKLVANLK
ncbi:MAG: hypothetical protein N4A32_02200 [Marinifilaceae bacterium]|jgi:uncharacterized protein YcgL (UPF0745 family)|nr:hypothetical protein [Marinifilaceae bacterium]